MTSVFETIVVDGIECTAVLVNALPTKERNKGCSACIARQFHSELCTQLNCTSNLRQDKNEVIFLTPDQAALIRLRGHL